MKLNRLLCVVLCWSMCVLPFQTYAYAMEKAVKPGLKTVIEITDVSDFWNRLQATSAFRGWNTDEMKKFTDPVKAQISRTLDSAKAGFGIDIKALANLLSGRVILDFDSKKEVVYLFCRPKKSVSIDENMVLLKAALNRSGQPFTETEKAGARVLIVKNREPFAVIYSKEKAVISFSGKDVTDRLAAGLMTESPPDICSVPGYTKKYPELKGPGLKTVSEAQIVLPDPDVNRTLEAANIPGMGSTCSRTYIENDRIHGISFAKQDMTKGVCSLVKKGPVSADTLKWAHESCGFMLAAHADLAAIPSVAQSIVEATGDQGIKKMYQTAIAQVQVMAGFYVEKDLFGSLGDEILILSLPREKGGGFPLFSLLGLNSCAAVIKLKDAGKFSDTADKITAFLSGLARMDQVNGGLRTQEYKGMNIQYMRVACGVLSPCFTVKDGYLVMTLNVPLMKHILDLHGGPGITDTEDFKQVSSLSGDNLGTVFTYTKPVSEEEGLRMGSFMAPAAAVWIAGMLGGLLAPSLGRARSSARRTACMNNLRQIGLGCTIYAQDKDGRFPPGLKTLVPDYVADARIFHCHASEKPGTSYVYLSGLTQASSAEAIVAFDKVENHGYKGRNVLFVDCHVEWMNEMKFRSALGKMLKEKYKKQYDQKAVEEIARVLKSSSAAQEGRPAPADKLSEARLEKFTFRNIRRFLIDEGKKIGSTIDFALFPRMETFPAARKSNFTNVTVKDNGIYTRSHTGHLIGAGGGSSAMISVGVIAIVAAIAVPYFLVAARPVSRGPEAFGDRAVPAPPVPASTMSG